MKIIATDKAPAAIGPYSQGYVVNGLLFTSGQIALIPATGAVAPVSIMARLTSNASRFVMSIILLYLILFLAPCPYLNIFARRAQRLFAQLYVFEHQLSIFGTPVGRDLPWIGSMPKPAAASCRQTQTHAP